MSKVWFITGASSGLGAQLAAAAIAKGDSVAATFRRPEQASAFSNAHAGRALGVLLDVTDFDRIPEAVQETIDRFGRIDVLVNNAGYGTIGALEEFSMEELRAQFETNFFGMAALTKAVLPLLRAQGSGHIVQLSSVSGFRAMAGFGLYNASKFALEGFSEALAQEVAPFGIRVVIVEPGPFRTEFLSGSMKEAATRIEAYSQTAVAGMYEYKERVTGKQEGDPEKAASVIWAYVHEDNPHLRLPLGKSAVAGIRSKLHAVQEDVDANEHLALKAMFGE
jgi:NAD(P)-dependent dehydrogenase (short-subunit alcohol dehydrogenase family)